MRTSVGDAGKVAVDPELLESDKVLRYLLLLLAEDGFAADGAGSISRVLAGLDETLRWTEEGAALLPEGPIVAAQLLVAWSHRGRLRSEAAFARLAGVAPLPASSGQTTRHRLSRGGDRQLNRALHTVVLHRRQHDPTTENYIAKRIAKGKAAATPPACSSAISPATCTGYCKTRSRSWLDKS